MRRILEEGDKLVMRRGWNVLLQTSCFKIMRRHVVSGVRPLLSGPQRQAKSSRCAAIIYDSGERSWPSMMAEFPSSQRQRNCYVPQTANMTSLTNMHLRPWWILETFSLRSSCFRFTQQCHADRSILKYLNRSRNDGSAAKGLLI